MQLNILIKSEKACCSHEWDKSLNSINDSEVPTTNLATYEDAMSTQLVIISK